MSADSKKSMGWTAILILLGVFAFYGNSRWLIVLVPAAMVVYYGVARSKFSGRRN